MVARNGVRRWCSAMAFAGLGALFPELSCPALAASPQREDIVQEPADGDLQRLRAMLSVPGVDGREARETAIERVLALPRPEAHVLLQERLRATDDADGVRAAIVAALRRQFRLAPASQFGGASGRVRERILGDYLRVLAPLWRDRRHAIDDTGGDVVRQGARLALQRLDGNELDQVARGLLGEANAEEQIDLMRCLADMQQVLFATTIAERLEAADPVVRAAAQESLQLLTCDEQPIRTRAQFTQWLAANGSMRYVDLVERAARRGSAPLERMQREMQAELSRLRVDAAREVVRAHVTRAPGIDWSAVQARVVVEDPAVLDACLELLQQALPSTSEDTSPARLTFARALLQRFRAEPLENPGRRARLLEVAAYLGRGDLARAEDAELAKDLIAQLVLQLDLPDNESRVAALRGLRRFPSAEARARLVALARRLLDDRPVAREQLAAILATLGARTAPRWLAPLPTDSDKADWLALVTAACRSDEALELREPALALAQTLDAREQRVPEVFDLLRELVRDPTLATKFRSTCAIHMQGWRSDPALAEAWLRAQQDLLSDPASELRQQAAESLATLTESVDPRRAEWIASTIGAVRDRLLVEPEGAVLRALVTCLQECGREPLMPEKAIGALRLVLAEMGNPTAPEQQFRIDALLQALATIGADPRADRGQWLAACPPLLDSRRRQSLRLILSNHAAIEFAKDVLSPEPGLAERARQAVNLIIETAVLKPPRDAWSSSEELQREARDVRAAFAALEALPEKDRLDKPAYRLLRLEVELVAGKPQEVVQRATAWLANGNGSQKPMSEEERNRMRVLAAEAQLSLNRPDAARRLVEERTTDAVDDAGLRDLESRIARALVATDLAGAVEMLGRVWRRTAPEDATFRGRLVEWMQLRVRLDPALRQDTLREASPHAALFAGPDCPAELREAFEQLRAAR